MSKSIKVKQVRDSYFCDPLLLMEQMQTKAWKCKGFVSLVTELLDYKDVMFLCCLTFHHVNLFFFVFTSYEKQNISCCFIPQQTSLLCGSNTQNKEVLLTLSVFLTGFLGQKMQRCNKIKKAHYSKTFTEQTFRNFMNKSLEDIMKWHF